MEDKELEMAIAETKKMLENSKIGVKGFKKYGQFYFHTNENIRFTLERLSFLKDRALSVMASGDQIFNLVYLGVKQIEAFDINLLTYFIYYLRRAIILAYGYEKSPTIEMMLTDGDTHPKKMLEIISSLRSFMPNDVYNFFEEIFQYNAYLYEYYVDARNNNFAPLCRCSNSKDVNLYNRSKQGFRRLEDNLEHSVVDFTCEDINNIPDILTKDYDLMHFSNIAEYYIRSNGEDSFIHLMWRFSQNLRSKGIIINYFFNRFIAEKLEQNFNSLKKEGFQGMIKTRTKNYESAVIIRKS